MRASDRSSAPKARAFGYETISYDPYVTDSPDPDLALTSLDDVLARSVPWSCARRSEESSRGILGREALAKVKPGLIVVNVGRDSLVDDVSLGEAPRDGRVAVAALDVRSVEPPDPLAGLDKVITTSHIASASIGAIADLATQTVDRLLALLEQGGRIKLRSSHA